MLEIIINPLRAEKKPWEMFFVGMVYASLSLILVKWFFGGDIVLKKYAGMIVVTFSTMFTLPFMYRLIVKEEKEDENVEGLVAVWKAHWDAIESFIWLFVGFLVAFSFWFIILGDPILFNAQIEKYCEINSPALIQECIKSYMGIIEPQKDITGNVTKVGFLLSIVENNLYVLIFTLIFSLIFGAGAIFVLSWNASVMSSAMVLFAQKKIIEIPSAFLRYSIHGLPEMIAYFIAALAGGMFGVGVIRHGIKSKRLIQVIENVLLLLIIAIIIIFIAGIIEVYITPMFF